MKKVQSELNSFLCSSVDVRSISRPCTVVPGHICASVISTKIESSITSPVRISGLLRPNFWTSSSNDLNDSLISSTSASKVDLFEGNTNVTKYCTRFLITRCLRLRRMNVNAVATTLFYIVILFLFVLPEHQTSDLNALPWRALIIRGLNSGVRHPPRTPIEFRIEVLDQKRLVRCHATSVIPSVLWARSQMPLLVVFVDGVGRLADDNPGRNWPKLVLLYASSIAHRQRLALDGFQRLPHVDNAPSLSS